MRALATRRSARLVVSAALRSGARVRGVAQRSGQADTRNVLDVRQAIRALLSADAPLLTMLRSGLADLSNEEYQWEPVPDCWSVRPVSELRTPASAWASDGEHALEISYPDPEPSPFTTIAWRLVHLTGSLNVATATLVGNRRPDGAVADAWADGAQRTPSSAVEAIELLEEAIDRLQEEISRVVDDDLARLERQWWDPPGREAPVWEHVLYFAYFEPASHAAEIRLLRDLYRHTRGGTIPLTPAG